MQSTEKRVSFTEQLGRYGRYARSLPRLFNPVAPMLGGGVLVTAGRLGYVASCSGDDADECVREAVRDGLIEAHMKNPHGYDMLDLYRVTARGKGEYERFREYADEMDAICREGKGIPFDEFIERVERGELLQVPDEWAAMDEKDGGPRRAAAAEAGAVREAGERRRPPVPAAAQHRRD